MAHTNLVTNNNKSISVIRFDKEMEEFIMSSRNHMEVPEAKAAMDRFKFEVASEIGVPLKKGYNGDLTTRQNGSVGGMMVKKMIAEQEKKMSGMQ